MIWKQDIELFLYLIYFYQFSQNLFHLYTYLSRAIVFTDCGVYRAVTKVCLARIYWYAYLAITFISILACTVMMIGSKIQAISMRITNHFGAWIDSFGKEIMIQTQQNKSSHKHVLCPLFLFDQMSLISIIVPWLNYTLPYLALDLKYMIRYHWIHWQWRKRSLMPPELALDRFMVEKKNNKILIFCLVI